MRRKLKRTARYAAGGSREHADLVVFAPHPDDEALNCGGIIARAVAQRKRVKVVMLTSGDGFPAWASLVTRQSVGRLAAADYLELARLRQSQVLVALSALGLGARDLLLLGYPDGGLGAIYERAGALPFRQQYTRRSETYGLVQPDYHTARHGHPAPYTRAAVLSDMLDILRALEPGEIYVTSEADDHPDHRAAFRFLRDAARAAAYRGEFYTFLVHVGREEDWPWPRGMTPRSRFARHRVGGQWVPPGVPWPPPRRVPLRPAEIAAKRQAIAAHGSHLAGATNLRMREYLESFLKSEEIFWPAPW